MIRRALVPALVAGALIAVSAAPSSAQTTRSVLTRPVSVAPAAAVNPWQPIRSLPAARYDAGAVTIGKTIYVGGGLDANSDDQTTFWAYSPTANTYAAKASLPTGIGRNVVFEGSGGKVYAFGVNQSTGDFHAFRYTPASNSWQTLGAVVNPADTPFVAYGVGASGRIYGIGPSKATTEVYTPASNTWATLAGTASPDATVHTNLAQDWSSSTGAFAPLPSATNHQHPVEFAATPIIGPDSRYYLIGGCDGPDEGDQECYPNNSATVLDPSTHRWGVTGPMSPFDASNGFDVASNDLAATIASGKIFVFGGEDDFLTPASAAAATFTPGDTTLPVVTQAPFAQPGTRTCCRSVAPNSITLTFKGSDANGISDMELQRRTNGGAWTDVPADAPFVTSNNGWFFNSGTFSQVAGQAGKTYQYRVLASDSYGNTSVYKAGPTWAAPILHQDAQASYTGAWTVTSASVDSGGSLHQSTQNGAAATFAFTGKGIALMSPDVPGTLTVSVDGGPAQSFSEHQFQSQSDVVWAMGFAASGTHTIRFVHTGTAKVTIDGFKVIS